MGDRPVAERGAAAGRAGAAPAAHQTNPTALAGRRSSRAAEGSPARVTALIVGGVLVGVAVLVVILTGGSSNRSSAPGNAGTSASSTSAVSRKKLSKASRGGASTKASFAPAGSAETNVVVLNGTGTTGLAHRISGELRQSGYSRATALSGRPPGANQVTVVEYVNGHRADAQGVARSLGVGQAQPMEATVESLSGSATVAVIVGLDKAATVP